MNMIRNAILFSWRQAMRRPVSTVSVVAMLAIGIGSVTAIYTAIDHVLLRSLPLQQPEQTVMAWGTPADKAGSAEGQTRWWTSHPDYLEYRDSNSSFDVLAAYRMSNIVVAATDGQPRRLTAARVSANFFELVNKDFVAGRGFTKQEDMENGEPVVVLNETLWQSLGGTAGNIGEQTVRLDGVSHRVVGVLPASLDFPFDARFWVPIGQNTGNNGRGQNSLTVIGQLAEGVSAAQAEADLAAIASRIAEQYPDSNANRSMRTEAALNALVGDYELVMSLLFGAAVLLLLVIASNVAGILLARGAQRRREVAVRAAVGASRNRLLWEFMAEAALYGMLGAVLGVFLAGFLLDWIVATGAVELPRLVAATVDPRIIAVSLLITMVATMLFGLWPAWSLSKIDVNENLKDSAGFGGNGSKAGWRFGNFRIPRGASMVLGQVILSATLAIMAGQVAQSLNRSMQQSLGFEPENRIVSRIFLPSVRYHPFENPASINTFYRQLLDGSGNIPGVTSAAVSYVHPLDPSWTTSYVIEGREPPPPGEAPEARFRPVTEAYFETAGIPLLKGRAIEARDDFDAPAVVVVNKAFADRNFPDGNALGQRFEKTWWWTGETRSFEIVGIAGNVRFDGPEAEPAEAMYFSQQQWPLDDLYLLVETRPGSNVLPQLRELLGRLDADIPVDQFQPMTQLLSDTFKARRFNTMLLGSFSVLAYLLAGFGIYSVLALQVSGRIREFGLRLSLGASSRRLAMTIVGMSAFLVIAGLGIAFAASWVSMRFAASLLYGVSSIDWQAAWPVAALFMLMALLAASWPALLVSRLRPSEALRHD